MDSLTFHLLEILSHPDAPNPLKISVLKQANKKLLDRVCECCLNTLKGNVKINKNTLHRLKMRQGALGALVDKRNKKDLKKRRKIAAKEQEALSLILRNLKETSKNGQ